jgi:hypothetical protein
MWIVNGLPAQVARQWGGTQNTRWWLGLSMGFTGVQNFCGKDSLRTRSMAADGALFIAEARPVITGTWVRSWST